MLCSGATRERDGEGESESEGVSGRVLALVAWQGGPAPVYGRHMACLAYVWSATKPGRYELVKPIRSTETTIIHLLYLLIRGEFVKTSVIQSVDLHEYYKIA